MKKDKKESKPALSGNNDEAVEERVRQMMDLSVPDTGSDKTPDEIEEEITKTAEAAVAPSAPEVEDSPIPVEPTEESEPNPEATEEEPEISDEEIVEEPDIIEASPEEKAFEDSETDKAVDDIVAHESDALLDAEDEKLEAAFDNKQPNLAQRVKSFFSAWWHNKKARTATIVVLLLIVAGVIAYPASRYFVLNSAGVRSKASLVVLDDSTQQPLKNVKVSLSGQTADTDQNGRVHLEHLKLGKQDLKIERRAFAPTTQKVTIGWGSNPLGDFKITPTGSQYAFVITDFLSGKPIEKIEAVQGELSAFSDAEGKLKITVEDSESNEVTIIIKGNGLREEKLVFNADTKTEQAVQMVPARKHAFISKRSGKYDVYKIDADGKNEEKILVGSGSEKEDMVLVPHPTENVIALVSTRSNQRNKDGFLLSTLTIINLDNNFTVNVTQSERVQIADWFGDRLAYVEIAAGTSGNNPNRHKLSSYDYKNETKTELASTNTFNSVSSSGGYIYYAPSSAYQTGKIYFYRIKADGTNRQTVLNKEVWNVFRTDYDKLAMSVEQAWYEHKISENKTSSLSGEPANLKSRVYSDSPDRKHSLWVDQRDGKGVLLNLDLTTKEEQELRAQSGLSNPVYWLNNSSIVFRIKTDQETADYAMSINGGEPKKIKNVTHTAGLDNWYYY